eukprot:GILI01009821.1.p1 GENE.GILI01009821.1~~GILI01009821.1.p1  ORF type:complete len:705 (+),score=161.32 GILI01009821.1:31-2145(+)
MSSAKIVIEEIEEDTQPAVSQKAIIPQKAPNSSAYYFNVDQAIKDDYAAAEAAKARKAIEDSTTITLDSIMKECVRQGYYRTPSCNEKLYLHHKGFNRIAEGAFDEYTDVKVMWLEGNCFLNEREKKRLAKKEVAEGVAASPQPPHDGGDAEDASTPAPSPTAFHCPSTFRSQHGTLRQMYLHGNLFTTTPRALAGFHSLDNINLSDNFIEAIEHFAPPLASSDLGSAFLPVPAKEGGNEDVEASADALKKQPQKKYTSADGERDYAWVDESQAAWNTLISSILDGEDEGALEDNAAATAAAEGTPSPPTSPSKGVSKSSKIVIEEEEDSETANADDCHLKLANDNDSSAKSLGDETDKRLKRFHKAIAAAVALRSVPIPATGILPADALGNNKWTKPKSEPQTVNNNDIENDGKEVAQEAKPLPHLSDTVTWIQLKNNHLKEPRDLLQLLTFSNLTSLDLSNNRIENRDGEFMLLLAAMPQLKSLMLQGNPCVRQITPQYRKQILKILPNLMYLDDRPVFADERRMITAWASGGADGEKKERAAMKFEEEEAVRKRLAEFRALMERRGELNGEPSESESDTSSDDDEEEEPSDNRVTNARDQRPSSSAAPTRVLSSNAANRPNTAFYDRNYGPNSAEPAPVHRQAHVDPMANNGTHSVSGEDTDAPNSVSWGNYVIRDRNAQTIAPPSQQQNDDDFSDVLIGH